MVTINRVGNVKNIFFKCRSRVSSEKFIFQPLWNVFVFQLSIIFISYIAMCRPTESQNSRHDYDEDESSLPCIFEGHLRTDKNWFGYLANISVIGVGRMTFEFIYPADRCCQNILFYTEDQISIISTRMNCWHREHLLHPEDDQILRLTPSFSWSGCHIKKMGDAEKNYICKGGRSFTVEESVSQPVMWFVAVSNCAAFNGLELQYKMEIHGHIGPCQSAFSSTELSTECPTPSLPSSSKALLIPREASHTQLTDHNTKVCTIVGNVNTTHNWFGFIQNLSLVDGGGFRFHFTYPYSMQIQNVILYHEEDIIKLHFEQICWLKESVIDSIHVPERVIDLQYRSTWNGCATKNGPNIDGNNLTCIGEKIFSAPRKLYLAVSNCRSKLGLLLHYKLEVFGYDNDICLSNGIRSIERISSAILFLIPICRIVVLGDLANISIL